MKKRMLQPLLALGALLFTLCLCAGLGSTFIPLRAVARVLFGLPVEATQETVIRAIRLPRVLCGALSGAALYRLGRAGG